LYKLPPASWSAWLDGHRPKEPANVITSHDFPIVSVLPFLFINGMPLFFKCFDKVFFLLNSLANEFQQATLD
jgi:hypothetical protein